jgi:hypothetical protein
LSKFCGQVEISIAIANEMEAKENVAMMLEIFRQVERWEVI